MKKIFIIVSILFLSLIVNYSSTFSGKTNLKKYISKDRRFKFEFLYSPKSWVLLKDIKHQRKSRFKDIAILMGENRVNQVRIATYKGLNSPNAKKVARLLAGEFIQQELKMGEQYMKVRDIKMPKTMVKNANAKEGWIISYSYYDRREGTLYNTYWIFYRKVVIPSKKPGKPDLVMGKAYIVRVLLKEKDYKKLIKDVLTVVKSFKFILN